MKPPVALQSARVASGSDHALLALGVAVLLVAVVDIIWTTLWVDGGSGPLSSRLTTVVWRGLRRLGSDRTSLLSLAGPLMLALTLAMWVGLIWAGWTLVFAGGENALQTAHSDLSVTWSGIIYFVAFTMFGMGNGGLYPPDGIWQILTALTTASGGLFVALGVSYVISVLGAVSNKRSFASTVTGFGDDGEELVRTGWNGDGFDGLQSPLHSLATDLDQLADQHNSYPILHYYHSEQPDQASPVAVAVLDEAATLLKFGVRADEQPDAVPIEHVWSAIENYIETLDDGFIDAAEETPPDPDLNEIRAEGIPTVADDEFASVLDDLTERRRKLRGIVQADEWQWPPIEGR